jgi:hypothetical protein
VKGQSSLEFLAYVALSSLLLATLYGVMMERQADAADYQVQRSAEDVLGQVSFEVEMALVQGDNYSRVFTLPERVAGKPYEVRVSSGAAILEYGDESVINPSRYQGDEISLQTQDTNVFRVVNDEGDISLQEE